MVNLELLQQLIVVAEEGTLSKAAETLLISQPSLTRNMKQLEEILGVSIFKRTKNRMTLNDTGLYTVEQAKQLLQQRDQFMKSIRRYDITHSHLFIGITSPSTINEMETRINHEFPAPQIHYDLKTTEELKRSLEDRTYQLIVVPEPIGDDHIICKEFIKEELYLAVPPNHPLANKTIIAPNDLNGESILLRSNIGIWQNLITELANVNFIIQDDWNAFDELIKASNILGFSTNLSQEYSVYTQTDRVHIPVDMPEAIYTFYICALAKNSHLLDIIG